MSETQNQKGYALSLEHLSHERIEVSNAEFLHEAFAVSAAHCGDCRPVTVSFAGDPARDARWLAQPFTGDDAPESPWANNYFALSAFKADSKGVFHRRKNSFVGQFVVALDDVTSVVVEGKQKAQIPSAVSRCRRRMCSKHPRAISKWAISFASRSLIEVKQRTSQNRSLLRG